MLDGHFTSALHRARGPWEGVRPRPRDRANTTFFFLPLYRCHESRSLVTAIYRVRTRRSRMRFRTRNLEGLLVVSLEQAVAAPLCTSRLADAGARVIKVRRIAAFPISGGAPSEMSQGVARTDVYMRCLRSARMFATSSVDRLSERMESEISRAHTTRWSVARARTSLGTVFSCGGSCTRSMIHCRLNRGKESLALDIKDPKHQSLLHRIISKADVFVQNLAPKAAQV